MEELQSRGAYNFLTGTNSFKHVYRSCQNVNENEGTSSQRKENNLLMENSNIQDVASTDLAKESREENTSYSPENTEDCDAGRTPAEPTTRLNQDLYSSFIPAQKVYSDRQLLKDQEVSQSIYEPLNIEVPVIEDSMIKIPKHLKVFVHPFGDVSDFPAPKRDQCGMLEYYLMDAASVLPVIALAPGPADSILDMCAAPGGKTLTMLQTLTTGNILANDISRSRLQRLGSILEYYCPNACTHVKKSQISGQKFDSPMFDKVLVDVPCSTDRHVLTSEENNLFKPGRINDRLQITNKQKELLLAGIKSCKPGGTVVYSTCSLAPTQNDGIIQAVFEDLWNTTKIDIAVENISWMSKAFSNTFRFFDNCRFGQLVLPTLRANFGPMYLCKIKRIN
ncbi:5-methylcytosine rRNA methyltransferase NSUN4-like isoform X2 [Liolophura sinensis]